MTEKVKHILDRHMLDKDKIYCGNCGVCGHSYRRCMAPITSLGII